MRSLTATSAFRAIKGNLFAFCLGASLFVHLTSYGIYLLFTAERVINSDDLSKAPVEVDFEDIPEDLPPDVPPELLGGDSNPAPVEKQDWVEGSGKDAPDAVEEDVAFNAISGTGTDKDGFLYSFSGDAPPTPIIDFDLKKYFPREAKLANITEKRVALQVQVDERGVLRSARIISRKSGYGFDEAAMKVIRMVRFRPGYHKGKPVKMNHELTIRFVLE